MKKPSVVVTFYINGEPQTHVIDEGAELKLTRRIKVKVVKVQ